MVFEGKYPPPKRGWYHRLFETAVRGDDAMQGLADKMSTWGKEVPEISAAWLVLQTLQGMTPERLHRLVETYGNPIKALLSPSEEFARIAGKKAAENLKHDSPADLARQFRLEAQNQGISILCMSDPDFPDLLKNIYAPPEHCSFREIFERAIPWGWPLSGCGTLRPMGAA